jgi:hypothetical protein
MLLAGVGSKRLQVLAPSESCLRANPIRGIDGRSVDAVGAMTCPLSCSLNAIPHSAAPLCVTDDRDFFLTNASPRKLTSWV